MSIKQYVAGPIIYRRTTPPVVEVVEWVRADPDEATTVGVSLVIAGLALIALAAIFRSDN